MRKHLKIMRQWSRSIESICRVVMAKHAQRCTGVHERFALEPMEDRVLYSIGVIGAAPITPAAPSVAVAVEFDNSAIEDVSEWQDAFGDTVATGDFNGDGYDDMAVGVSKEDVNGLADAGAVNVIYGGPNGLRVFGDQLWTQTQLANTGPEAGDRFGRSLATGDFDGDGYDDLAVGSPNEDLGVYSDTGVVHIIYGSATGLTASGNQMWHQNKPGIGGSNASNQNFGWSLVAGDFDGDGRDDLAVGVKGENVGGQVDAGAVNVIYGSNAGLTAAGDQYWHRNRTGIEDVAQTEDYFGWTLAAGDFNGDGHDDLAVGVYGDDVFNGSTGDVGNIAVDGGSVHVLYGFKDQGLAPYFNHVIYQTQSHISGNSATEDWFGYSLAAGDFDNNGRDDLAIGVPRREIGTITDAGAVVVIEGTYSGLLHFDSLRTSVWHQNRFGIAEVAEAHDRFGTSVTTGDFNGDGKSDLAVGTPREHIGSVLDAGAVNVIYGHKSLSDAGLNSIGDQLWHQDSPGISDVAQNYDWLGFALASGDFDGDGRSDLAIGVPSEDLGAADYNHGVINAIYGRDDALGLTSENNQIWHQNINFGVVI